MSNLSLCPDVLSRHDSSASPHFEVAYTQPQSPLRPICQHIEPVEEPLSQSPASQHSEHLSTASTALDSETSPLLLQNSANTIHHDLANPPANARTQRWLSSPPTRRPHRSATFPGHQTPDQRRQQEHAESEYRQSLAQSHRSRLQRTVSGAEELDIRIAAQTAEIQMLRYRLCAKEMESARKADEVGKAWERRIVVLQEENAELVVQNQGLLYQNIQLQLEQQTVRGNLTAPALREVPTLDRGDRETEERERLVAVILKQRAELQRLHCRICLYGRLVTRLRGRSQDVEAIIEQQRQLIDGYRADIGDLKGLLRDKEREVVDDLRIDGGGWAIAVILGLMVIAGWVSSLADTK